ncbi:hypothetical protein O181_032736 [Austropuccinia psidii MF-1]|uniref:BHLH domain-containing protein n=1 Tax=Austropuccinia psidii MF-1 TaxID=1389203 RepID=A0A9Q3CXD4_9BASI|nr:hypothetical protein [Austropuccinia psidii MF-1]
MLVFSNHLTSCRSNWFFNLSSCLLVFRMVSYSNLDTSNYFNQPADFTFQSSSTNTSSEPINLPSRSNSGPGGGNSDPQQLKEILNNHIGLAVADLFQNVGQNSHNQLSSQHHPIISNQHPPLILPIPSNLPRNSPFPFQDQNISPQNSSKPLSIDTSLSFDNFQNIPSNQIKDQSSNSNLSQSNSNQILSTQALDHLSTTYRPTSITPSPPITMAIFSSASTSISPTASAPNPNSTHEDRLLSSAPGSSISKSPQTDSSISSRQTDQSIRYQPGYPTPPNPEVVFNSLTAQNSTTTLIGSRDTYSSHDHPNGDLFETPFVINSTSSNGAATPHFNHSTLTQTSHYQTFKDLTTLHHPHQPPIGNLSHTDPNVNSSPTDLTFKQIALDAPRSSIDTNSPMINNPTCSTLSSSNSIPSTWNHTSTLSYHGNHDFYSPHQLSPVFYPPNSNLQSNRLLPTVVDQTKKSSKSINDQNKLQDRYSFALNNSNPSPNNPGQSPDDLIDHQIPSETILSSNLSVSDHKHSFNYQISPQGSKVYDHSTSLDGPYKITDHNHSNGDPTYNSLGLLPSYYARAPYMEKIPENLIVLGEPGCVALNNHHSHVPEESGHNAVEKRYRNNINSHIASLADLVPALQHLRSLPSAATSRRHSSQFIVSTSAIGKIPTGLVDGVKAATKLSKGNILSKSVDYVRHLIRTRTELKEDIQDLKNMVKSRVEGGEILILQWEELVNAKTSERERQRVLEQSQGDEEFDEEEDVNDSNNPKVGGGGTVNNLGLNSTKKRKIADIKNGDGGKLKGLKSSMKTLKKTQQLSEFHHKHHGINNLDEMIIPSNPSSSSSNIGPTLNNLCVGKQEPTKVIHNLVNISDEFDLLRQTPSNYHQQFIGNQSNHHEYNQLQSHNYSSDFMGHPFNPAPTSEPHVQHTPSNLPRPLLAAFMGISFIIGSGYNYQQARRQANQKTSDWNSPDQPNVSRTSLVNSINPIEACSSCRMHETINQSRGLLSGFLPHFSAHNNQPSVLQAGLNAMSIASILWTLMLMFKPEFFFNFLRPNQFRNSKIKKRPKTSRQVIFEEIEDDSDNQTNDEGIKTKSHFNVDQNHLKSLNFQITGNLSQDEEIILGQSMKSGKFQYERLSILIKRPICSIKLVWELLIETSKALALMIWGDVIEKFVLDCHKREGKHHRSQKIKEILIWTRIAEIETSWDISRAYFLKRLHTVIKLNNLSRSINWNDHETFETFNHGRIFAVLALLLRTLLGESNQLSWILWRKALESHMKKKSALKNSLRQGLILPSNQWRPSYYQSLEESWLNESLILGYKEVCELLDHKKKIYKLMSSEVGEFGQDRGGIPLKEIAETKAELKLIEIWSRIFVSAITKTCPIEETTKNGSIKGAQFGLDGGLAELPTRVEEAGAPYALQISQARRSVEQSIEHICRLGFGSGSPVGQMAKVTRGMWATAFGKRELGVAVAEELKAERKMTGQVGCVAAYMELVLDKQFITQIQAGSQSTLDKLAKMTISWLLIRREHALLNVAKALDLTQDESIKRRKQLKKRCEELKSVLKMAIIESERNRELNARSTKQTDEAVQAGEAREIDLKTAIEECQRSVEVIQLESLKKQQTEADKTLID